MSSQQQLLNYLMQSSSPDDAQRIESMMKLLDILPPGQREAVLRDALGTGDSSTGSAANPFASIIGRNAGPLPQRENILSNEQLKTMHMQQREKFADIVGQKNSIPFSFTNSNRPTPQGKLGNNSPMSLSKRRPLKIRDLKLDTTHTGCYLKGKSILPGFAVVGCNILLQDSDNNIIRVSVYNAVKPHAPHSVVEKYFPVGKEVIILDPYCKLGTNDAVRMIRVDDPSTVIIPDDETSEKSTSGSNVAALIDEGNDLFKKKEYFVAHSKYKNALRKAHSIRICLQRRAECWIKMHNEEHDADTRSSHLLKAYRDSMTALQLDDSCADSELSWFIFLTCLSQLPGARLECARQCHRALSLHDSPRISAILEQLKFDYTYDSSESLHYYPPASLWSMTSEKKSCSTSATTSQKKLFKNANSAFKKGEYKKAAELYTRSLNASSALKYESQRALGNLAAVQQQFGVLYAALNSSQAALTLNPSDSKNTFRRATFLSKLYQFDACHEILSQMLRLKKQQIAPVSMKHIQTLRAQNTTWRAQHERGEYDWKSIAKQVFNKPKSELSLAEYFNREKLQLASIAGKGRGFVAKQAIEPGELLLVCKRLSLAETDSVLLSFESNRKVSTGGHYAVLEDLARISAIDNSILYTLHFLCDGTSNMAVEDALHMTADWKTASLDPQTLDTTRVQSIINSCSFSACPFGKQSILGNTEEEKGTCLLTLGSFFNHSNAMNVNRYTFGPYFVFRSTRQIKKDEELTTCYVPPDAPYEKRKEVLEHFGIKVKYDPAVDPLVDDLIRMDDVNEKQKWLEKHPDICCEAAVGALVAVGDSCALHGEIEKATEFLERARKFCIDLGCFYSGRGTAIMYFLSCLRSDKWREADVREHFRISFGFPESHEILVEQMKKKLLQ